MSARRDRSVRTPSARASENCEKNVGRSDSLKLVHVIGALVAGGAERFVVSLLKRLKSDGMDVSLWALSNRLDRVGQDLEAELARKAIPYEIGPTRRLGLASVRWYAQLLAAKRPALVHLHTPNTELTHLLSSVATRTAFSRRTGALMRTIHNTEPPTSWILRQAYRRKSAVCSIACGEAVAGSYANAVTGELIHISNGVEFCGPIKSRQSKFVARDRLNLDHSAFHAVNIGRMSGSSLHDAQKAHDVMLQGWRSSGLGQKAGVLHLLGDGNLRAQLEQLANGDPSIRFHGVTGDTDAWLQAADCFVMPSRFEGLPIAGLEAVGAGLPCIFSDIPPLRELSPPAALWCATAES